MYIYSCENLRRLSKTLKGKSIIHEFESFYQANYKNKDICSLSFSDYKSFFIDGNRINYELPFFERRKRLSVLQLLAMSDDKYVGELEEIIGAICDEYTWVVPAHKKDNEIDLFAAETARILAETTFVFDKQLSSLIKERVKESLYRKIVQKYENKTHWWDNTTCNWAAVCACGVGLTYIYIFPERYDANEKRLFNSFMSFLSGFDEEGYCYEGINYWQYGFSNFCLFFDVYEKLKGCRPKFIDSKKIKKIIRYAHNARMSEDIYLPFADGGYPTWIMDANMAYTIKSLYPDDFEMNKLSAFLPTHSGLCLRDLVGVTRFDGERETHLKEESIYYESAQVFIKKTQKYSFAVQCGNNGIIHNHNDVGAFQIVSNNQRVICDFGAGQYTKEYFGSEEQRYKIFACNSLSHSVPIVDGEMQMWGSDYYGEVLSHDNAAIIMDIAKAYKNGPKKLIIEYHTENDCVLIKYNCVGLKEKISFHFVSDLMPIQRESGVQLGNAMIVSNLDNPNIVCRKEIPNDPLRISRGGIKARDVYTIDYELFGISETTAEFKIII